MTQLRIVLIVLAIGAATAAATAQERPGLPDAPHVTVVGEGSAEGPADGLDVGFEIEIFEAEAAVARAAVDERATAFITALHDAGVARDGISVTELTLDIEYKFDDDDLAVNVGYRARRTVHVSLTDFDLFDVVVERAIASGISSFQRPRLRTSRERELRDLARTRAIEDATAQARAIATGFGRQLGPVYGITTKDARRWSRRSVLYGDPDDRFRVRLEFKPGPIAVTRQVYVTFLLGPDEG